MSSNIQPKIDVDQSTQKVTITNPTTPATACMIFMHGLGDTAFGWADGIAPLVQTFPFLKCVLPTATPKPVTLNMGMAMPSWYDIKSLTDREGDTADGIEDSRRVVQELMAKEINNGIPKNRIIVAGFSQGGALSLYTALQEESGSVAGVAALSGYIPNAQACN